jgi:hypothetical protein
MLHRGSLKPGVHGRIDIVFDHPSGLTATQPEFYPACANATKPLGQPNATPRLVNKGLSLIRQGMTYQQAAEQSGVSISTLLRARRKGKAA